MSTDPIKDKILQAIKDGASTRPALMAIEALRHQTWAVVAKHLADMTKQGTLVASKAGWRIA
jgi:type IV secretory pathway VirD2 relaxase